MTLRVSVVLAALAVVPVARADTQAKSGSSADRSAVTKLETDWTAAWNRHDANGLAGVFSEQADLMNPMGHRAKGTAQITDLFRDEHADRLKSSTMKLDCEPARFYDATVAQVDCDYTLEGMTDPKGPSRMQGHWTSIAVRGDDGWKLASTRAFVPRLEGQAKPAARNAPTMPR